MKYLKSKSRLSARIACCTAALALTGAVSAADQKEHPREVPITTGISAGQADEIIVELKAIRALLERQQPPAPTPAAQPASATIKIAPNVPMLGLPDAPVTVIEFTDLQCTFCQQFHQQAFPDIRNNYVDAGKVRFISFDLPLSMHPLAMQAAVAVRCAGEQGQFWPMRHGLIASGAQMTLESITNLAATLRIDKAAFETCRTSGKFDATIREHGAIAAAAGISGTPSFVVGKTSKDGVEGAILVGSQPYATFDSQIKKLLAP